MKQKTVIKIYEEYGKRFDELPDDRLDMLSCFNLINTIVSKYHKEEVNTLMNITYNNGNPVSGICFVTDFHPGGLLFQSTDNFAPKLRIIYPEEMNEFLDEYGNYIMAEYPEISDDE